MPENETIKNPSGKIVVKAPANGSVVGEAKSYTFEEAKSAVERARAAQKAWAAASFEFRKEKIIKFASILMQKADEVARLLSRETGKTIYEATLFEVIPLIHLSNYFAKKAHKILKPQKISVSLFKHRASYLHYKPRGVVFIISPWNFPLTIPIGEVVMSLLAGNAVILKPASLTPLVSLKARELFDEAGLDPDLFQVIPGPGAMAGQIIDQCAIDYVNFTGSTEVGKIVAMAAAKRLIPFSMELGGKAPAIICEDANLKNAAKAITWGAFANSGQICASVERVYVHESVYDEFVNLAVEETNKLRQGDPANDYEIDVGSMTDPRQIDILQRQVADAKERGGKILAGGKLKEEGKMFFEPTVIVDVDDDAMCVREESFGPLMPIMKYKTEEEVIARANNTRFGLLGYVFSGNKRKAKAIAERIQAGTVIINEVLITHAMPETPWMTAKESGIGFVHSDEGLRHLCSTYHVNYDLINFPYRLCYPYQEGKVNTVKKVIKLLYD